MKFTRLRLVGLLIILLIQVIINPKEVLRFIKEAMMIRDYRRIKRSQYKILQRARRGYNKEKGDE